MLAGDQSTSLSLQSFYCRVVILKHLPTKWVGAKLNLCWGSFKSDCLNKLHFCCVYRTFLTLVCAGFLWSMSQQAVSVEFTKFSPLLNFVNIFSLFKSKLHMLGWDKVGWRRLSWMGWMDASGTNQVPTRDLPVTHLWTTLDPSSTLLVWLVRRQ